MSLQNLEICGLTAHLLGEFKRVASSQRDRVEVCSDGSYMLLEERKVRGKKRPIANDRSKAQVKSQKTCHDVIEIL